MKRRRPSSRGQVLACCTALLGFAVLVAACGDRDRPGEPGAGYDEVKAKIRPLIRSGLLQSQVPGLSIALVDDQDVVWSEGFGFADRAAQVPATAQTVYEAGSISKLFTATAIMQRVEQGRAGLDQPIQELIPGFAIQSRFPQSAPVTLRNLLTHHAGIPEQLMSGYAETPLSLPENMEHLREDSLAYPANEFWAYSNTGFVVLGRAVETTSGEEFTAHLREHVLEPLGMTHSSFRLEPHIAPRMAKGEGPWAAEDIPPTWLESQAPAGSLRSSVEDMSRFIRMLLAEGKSDGVPVLQPGSLQEMWRQQNAGNPLDLDTRIGLTWYLYDYPLTNGQSVRMVYHNGTTFSFQSMMILLPEHKLGVVVLANARSAATLVATAAQQTLAHALEAKSGLELAVVAPEPRVQPVQRAETELRALTGMYASELGPLKIDFESGTLFGLIADSRFELAPHEQGFFKTLLGGAPLWVSFEHLQGRDVLILHAGPDARQLFAERITPSPVLSSWNGWLGSYALARGARREIAERAVLSKADGYLVLEASGGLFEREPMVLMLRPEGDDRAVVLGLGRGKGEVVRFERKEGGNSLVLKGIRLQLQPAVP
ncbi:serine hydrolase domain-containing protein [Hyalangium sp.]|uniref:serine hydrolase domain-containing protein n=1 Tax=Hyalangium sp. TaxID=2028555 RepID=UPI002D6FC8A1|nr:serine hydrolase domain-containing protein [Hyalangium sp.]HYI01664.1 serine hydrolase domain-containing protein [Hyalangium sp.]